MADAFDDLINPVKADPFAALVNSKPEPVVIQAKNEDPFEALVGSQKAYAVTQSPQAAEPQAIEDKFAAAVSGAIPDEIKEGAASLGEYVINSPVGTALKYLNKPLNAVSGAIVEGAEKVSPGIKAALNPENKWVPDIAYHDIVNYMAPSNDKAEAVAKQFGLRGMGSDAARMMYASAKWGVGLAADVLLDPINMLTFGTLTPASRAARLAGDVAALDRNAVAIGAFGKELALPAKTIAKGAEKVGSAIKKVPGGEAALNVAQAGLNKVDNVIDYFDYRTKVPEIDLAASMHAGLKRGDQRYIKENFFDPIAAKKFTPEEQRLVSKVIESTPNNATVEQISEALNKTGASLPPNRIDDIAQTALKIKAENALDLNERVAAGIIPGGENQKVIENYLVHKISPQAMVYAKKNPALAAAVTESELAKKVDASLRGNYLSSFDSGVYGRKIRTTLEEANAALKEKTGVEGWFIEDPLVATAMKRAETRKLVRDKELLDVVEKHGMLASEARRNGITGWKKIDHPEFAGKIVQLKNGNTTKLSEMVFPPNVANKMGYYMVPRETGSIEQFFDSYNRVFRTFALSKPDYYLQNWGENMFKNYVQGVKMDDYADAIKLASGKGFINVRGKPVPAESIIKDFKKFGVDTGGQFKEGLDSVLYAGKKMNEAGAFKRGAAKAGGKVVDLFKGMAQFGEKGENYTRRALYINRIKQGFKPEIAALDVERYLFDFSRNSAATNAARRFYDPFIQAAIKTAQIAPEMIGARPGAYNFLQNNLLDSIENAINDPVTADEIKLIIPKYRQYQDPIAGPLLPGNSFLARLFTNENTPKTLGGKVAPLFKAPVGMDILNRFSLWDDQFGKQGGVVSPVLRSFGMIAFGKDPFNGRDLDPVKGSADMARRMNYAADSFISSAIPLPNTYAMIKQQLGIGDPKFFTPMAVSMLHGSMGKFANVTNLDKEYLFKTMAYVGARKQLMVDLKATLTKEMSGRTSDISFADKDFLRKIVQASNRPFSSSAAHNRLLQGDRNMMLSKMAGAGLQGQMSAAEIVKNIKEIDKQVAALNKNFETVSEVRLRVLKEARDEEIKELVPEYEPAE